MTKNNVNGIIIELSRKKPENFHDSLPSQMDFPPWNQKPRDALGHEINSHEQYLGFCKILAQMGFIKCVDRHEVKGEITVNQPRLVR